MRYISYIDAKWDDQYLHYLHYIIMVQNPHFLCLFLVMLLFNLTVCWSAESSVFTIKLCVWINVATMLNIYIAYVILIFVTEKFVNITNLHNQNNKGTILYSIDSTDSKFGLNIFYPIKSLFWSLYEINLIWATLWVLCVQINTLNWMQKSS